MAKETPPSDFQDASKVMAILESMQTVENVRAQDRALIDTLFNGKRPFTDAEVQKHQIRINVNWNEGNKILQDANRQVNSATLHVGKFFTAQCQKGPIEKRSEWSVKFTNNLNQILKPGQKGTLGKRHLFLRRNRNASICLHGVGPLMWMSPYDPLPRFIPLEDLLIPTDTTLDLDSLTMFGVNLYLTQGEFYDLSHSDTAQKGWNKTMVKAVLDALKDPKTGNMQNPDFLQQPEKWQENFKENKCYYTADSISRVRLRLFLFQDAKTKKWYRRIILREMPSNIVLPPDFNKSNAFIFESDEVFADSIDHILHVQYGDCSIVPPLKYHSVRGLGTMLYSVIEIMNRMRCQTAQHVFDMLQTWLRIQNPQDRARQAKVDLFPYSVIEDGVSIVPQTERHQIDPGLVNMMMSQFRQLMSESSASFVQDVNDGTQKEMTATEAQARIQSVNVMVGGMLQMMYSQETFYFKELIRRFCMKNPTDDNVILFQKMCKKDGIPSELMDADAWMVEIEKVLGAGDQMLAQQEATALLSQSQRFDPSSQRKILHQWTQTITRNPDLANQLVPIKPPDATDGVYEAEDVFATLMEGIPVTVREGIDQFGYIESMIGMMSAKIGQIEQATPSAGETGGMATPEQIVGLATVANDIEQHIGLIAQNPENKQKVKEYADALGILTNELKAMAQRLGEQMKSQMGDTETQAKAQSILMLAQTKSRVQEAQALQKLQMKQAQFSQKMQQDMIKNQQKMQAEITKLQAELAGQTARTQADIVSQGAKTQADIKMNAVKTVAE